MVLFAARCRTDHSLCVACTPDGALYFLGKVPTDLLNTFKAKATLANTPYQTQIKALMKAWVLG